MTGGLGATLTHPAAVLHQATARGGDGDVPVTTPRVPAREDAERELSRPEYHEHDPGLLQRTLDWLWDRIGDLLSSAAGATPGGWVGLSAVAVVLILLVVALRIRLGKLRTEPTSARGFLFADGPRSADEHRATAEAHAANARWGQALQERMRAIVRSLEERALLDPRPGRTSDEAALEAGQALPDHAADLRAAAHAFDEVTYAERPADQHTYTRVADLDTALQHTTPHSESSTSTTTAATPRGGIA
jgi:hypothetical protein